MKLKNKINENISEGLVSGKRSPFNDVNLRYVWEFENSCFNKFILF